MSLFPAIDKILDNAVNLNPEKVWVLTFDEEVKQEIIRLNTRDQMFDKGVDSLNRSLGVYSARSVQEFGKRKGRIQLFDEGSFYASFIVRVDRGGITISADTIKTGDDGVTTDLAVRYGIDILGLTDESQHTLIIKLLIDKYVKIVRDEILQ